METPEEQAKKAEQANKELAERTVKIELTPTQLNIINSNRRDIDSYQEKIKTAQQKESDIVTFAIEFSKIDIKKVESVAFGESGEIVVTLKPIEKKSEEVMVANTSEQKQKLEKLKELVAKESENHK